MGRCSTMDGRAFMRSIERHPFAGELRAYAQGEPLGEWPRMLAAMVVSTEIGVHWGIPVLSYSKDMMSPVGYRHPEAGHLLPDTQPVFATQGYALDPAVRVPPRSSCLTTARS